jgi:hypothetical protein
MKKLLSMTLAVMALTLIFTSCEHPLGDKNTEDVIGDNFESLFVDNSINSNDAVTSDLTLDNEMELLIDEPAMQFESPERPPQRGRFIPLARVFREMELNEAQMDSVRKYSILHHRCKWTVKRSFYENVRPYMDSVNQERRIVLQQLRNEEITREEARELIEALNQNAREFMQTAKARILMAMRNCDIIFFERIASILNDEQLEIWEEFLEDLRERAG